MTPENLAAYGRCHAVVSLAGPLAEVRLPSTKAGFRFRASTHEAGHLVVAAALIRVPFEVSVAVEADTNGEWIGGFVALNGSALRDDAGRFEAVPHDRRAAIANLWTALPGIDYRGLRREMRECHLRADELLDKHWPAVQAIAGELLWTKRLGREQIEAILEDFELS